MDDAVNYAVIEQSTTFESFIVLLKDLPVEYQTDKFV
jgi:hypothetical protein